MKFQVKLTSAKLEKRMREEARHYAVLLQQWGVTPNGLTTFGLLINLTAAYFVLRGQLAFGAIFLLCGGFVDLLDGTLARLADTSTKFGMYWDSVADKISEAVFYIALIVNFVTSYNYFGVLFALFAMAGSWLVTYTGTSAEKLRIKVESEFLLQPERIIILAITLIFGRATFGLAVVAMLTIGTVIWRTLGIYRHFQLKTMVDKKQKKN